MPAGPGRPKGSKDKRPGTPQRIASQAANAKKPRGSWPNVDEKAVIDRAKAKGRKAITDCMDLWVALVRGEVAGAEIHDRRAAAKEIADRCGLPVRTEQEILGDAGFPPVVIEFREAVERAVGKS